MFERPLNREATVADVARRAGVGKSTASRALGSYGSVSSEVRLRVLAAAEELDYRPNEVARSMNTGRSRTLGVIVSDIENPYFSVATRGITDAANASRYNVILANTSENLEAEIHAVRVFLDKRVDAIIVAPSSAYQIEHLKAIRTSGRPLVLLDRKVPGLDAVSVEVSIAPAAHEATSRLVELGHTRIAYISSLQTDGDSFAGFPLGISSVEDRLHGILDALKEAAIRPDPELIRFKVVTMERTAEVIEELLGLADPPTAILASDSTIARDILLALRERDVGIPANVSVIALDDFPWSPLTGPPLTVVSPPIYEAGFAAAVAAIDAIEERTAKPVALQARVIYRNSHGPAPTRSVG
ncbi:LacI family DNA-binding transcriptional regulator [Arthrobacter burdickii]|uniref:LacI family DNA-binding transcriptional regulator n=1 Tax=Arthrobacter burdickii TaxID=3035920 RepID=A0ABT8JYZ9_9MICC|nr:LacI family DNA-binding transcriptional regulator [Arthrobacter burdickii]MDN4609826.1 LacI family DNA-binding transcriptional regulator [Arthrobacter burdickii]